MGNLLDALQIFEGDPEDFYTNEYDFWSEMQEIRLNPDPVIVPTGEVSNG